MTSPEKLNENLWNAMDWLKPNLIPVGLIIAAALFFWIARARMTERTRKRVAAAAEAYATRELSLERIS